MHHPIKPFQMKWNSHHFLTSFPLYVNSQILFHSIFISYWNKIWICKNQQVDLTAFCGLKQAEKCEQNFVPSTASLVGDPASVSNLKWNKFLFRSQFCNMDFELLLAHDNSHFLMTLGFLSNLQKNFFYLLG